jgi:hypothetical protein
MLKHIAEFLALEKDIRGRSAPSEPWQESPARKRPFNSAMRTAGVGVQALRNVKETRVACFYSG